MHVRGLRTVGSNAAELGLVKDGADLDNNSELADFYNAHSSLFGRYLVNYRIANAYTRISRFFIGELRAILHVARVTFPCLCNCPSSQFNSTCRRICMKCTFWCLRPDWSLPVIDGTLK